MKSVLERKIQNKFEKLRANQFPINELGESICWLTDEKMKKRRNQMNL
jgi:hypothetical protein